uniref:DUF4881 domain-containing protein n=1 Tax=Desulfobacca acetoxidans TaxID=60893 RepID=A0A7C3UYW7_9BACT
MLKKLWCLTLLSLLPLAFGCGDMGKVDQGRVIAFDKAKGTVTLIQDKKGEPGKPDYDTLPPHTYSIPEDPKEMGPEPKAGLRMKLDLDKKVLTIYDPETKAFKNITFEIVEQKTGVGKDDPLVAGKSLPAVDKEKKTLTLYSGRQKLYAVLKLPEEYLDRPVSTWDAGDEVRIYYKEPGKALRLMNISKTDIFKK